MQPISSLSYKPFNYQQFNDLKYPIPDPKRQAKNVFNSDGLVSECADQVKVVCVELVKK